MLKKKIKSHSLLYKKGFTLVELMIISPIIIIAVVGVIALLVNLVSDNIVTSQENAMNSEVQSALDEIKGTLSSSEKLLSSSEINNLSDVKKLEYSNPTPSPTQPFRGMRIGGTIYEQAVNSVLSSSTPTPAYKKVSPDNCSSQAIVNNEKAKATAIFFAKDVNSSSTELKRRIITSVPRSDICNNTSLLHQESCEAAGKTTSCARDAILARNVVKFNITYLPDKSAANADEATGVKIELVTKKRVAGKDVRYSAVTRFNLLNQQN